ncbi:hypothetical protein [Geothermobacter hydrogeniphilus]|uniref:Uncharacterized protein n=1 Tax=Geothermobacter hydrogeniphilus TaxID=1969733 RepID=A0A1X0Y880_9BACT|nr:hypothetical protein [Geothermobacter hydrogeniphilus]ORJ61309.1 hypothetical protein B5V00_06670 [Geothermobacter hydrogeniphilus]
MSKPDNEAQSGFLVYAGRFPGSIGICHLRIIPGARRTVFLASELANNPGPSVTNSIENIWKNIQNEFPDLSAHDSLLVEHYDEKVVYGEVNGRARYDEVCIGTDGVHWRHRSPDEIAELAGIPVSELVVAKEILNLNACALEDTSHEPTSLH